MEEGADNNPNLGVISRFLPRLLISHAGELIRSLGSWRGEGGKAAGEGRRRGRKRGKREGKRLQESEWGGEDA